MPNWAYTKYVATGNPEEVEKLYKVMNELESMEDPGLVDNGFGSSWMGNLVTKLGGDVENIHCRGSWSDLQFSNGKLQFETSSAWREMEEVRRFIEEKFPGTKLYYQSEESGNSVYLTNDETGQFFPARFYLMLEDGHEEYYDTLESLIRDVEEITGFEDLDSFESCEDAIISYAEDNEVYYCMEEFIVIPD